MSAYGNNELFLNLRKQAEAFVLQPRTYDFLSIDQFRKCFPRSYRSHRELDVLYDEYLAHREDVRVQVKRDIQTTFARLEEAGGDLGLDDVEGLDLQAAVAFLTSHQKTLQTALRKLEAEIADAAAHVQAAAERLEVVARPVQDETVNAKAQKKAAKLARMSNMDALLSLVHQQALQAQQGTQDIDIL